MLQPMRRLEFWWACQWTSQWVAGPKTWDATSNKNKETITLKIFENEVCCVKTMSYVAFVAY